MIRYISFVDKNKHSGIVKKINYQVAALCNLGYGVKEYNFSRTSNFIQKIFRIIPFISINAVGYIDDLNDGDILYIRYNFSDKNFIKSLKSYKRKKVKIILEIPTFPYENELRIYRRIKDRIYRKELYKYVDNIANVSNNYDKILGIKTINISNGIDVDEYKIKNSSNSQQSVINLIGVAGLNKWHGYDRVIRGIRNAYDNGINYKIYFNIVGGGKGANKLNKLAKKLNVSDSVICHGYKEGRELDNIFNKSDVAIGTLGFHRTGVREATVLKNREYCVRGIPFICSVIDKDFVEDFPYLYQVEASDEAVNIEGVIKFYNNIINKCPNYSIEMHKFAKENLTWISRMKKVLDEC